jgi:hypothetical protein
VTSFIYTVIYTTSFLRSLAFSFKPSGLKSGFIRVPNMPFLTFTNSSLSARDTKRQRAEMPVSIAMKLCLHTFTNQLFPIPVVTHNNTTVLATTFVVRHD